MSTWFRSLAMALVFAGCASSQPAPTAAARDEAPAWASLPAGPVVDGEHRYLRGVGSAGPELDVKFPALRRTTAQNRARNAVQDTLTSLIGFLGTRWYQAGEVDEEMHVGLMTKTLYSGAGAHITIVDTVVSGDGIRVWAQAQLPLTAVAETLASYDDLRPWSEFLKDDAGLEEMFDDFAADRAARKD